MVRFEKVSLKYDGNQGNTQVLKNVTFDLKKGSFNFLTGSSGAGKSSLLKLMYLGHKPSGGKVEIFGEKIVALNRFELAILRRKIGVVFQDFRLLNNLSALENVALPLRIAGAKPKQITQHVSELLSWVGLSEKIDDFPTALSDGEKQRVAIARAVIGRPNLLLADEPTGSIDSEQGERIMHLFEELNKIGTTTVIATHDNNLTSKFGYPELQLVNGSIEKKKPNF